MTNKNDAADNLPNEGFPNPDSPWNAPEPSLPVHSTVVPDWTIPPPPAAVTPPPKPRPSSRLKGIPDSWLKTVPGYFEWIMAHFDHYDYKLFKKDAPIFLISNETMGLHYRAFQTRGYGTLPKLGKTKVAASRTGDYFLHASPAYRKREDDTVHMVLRLDFDAHDGEQDVKALCSAVNQTFFGNNLYTEPSANGMSGWFTLIVPAELAECFDSDVNEWVEEKKFFPAKSINLWVDKFQNTLQWWAAWSGFEAQLEILGRYNLKRLVDAKGNKPPYDQFKQCLKNPDYAWQIEHRGTRVKLPRLPLNEADLAKLKASRLGFGVMLNYCENIRELARQLSASDQHANNADNRSRPPASAQTPTVAALLPTTTPARSSRPTQRKPGQVPGGLNDVVERLQERANGKDKNRARVMCMAEALNLQYGTDRERWPYHHDLDNQTIADLADLADKLYNDASLTRDPRDKKRERDWRDVLAYLLGKGRQNLPGYQPTATPGQHSQACDRLDPAHLLDARLLLEAVYITKELLKAINRTYRARLSNGTYKVTMEGLAVTLTTCARDILRNDDCAAPWKSVDTMLKSHGIKTGRSLPGLMIDILEERGLIHCVRRVTTKHQARKFRLDIRTLKLGVVWDQLVQGKIDPPGKFWKWPGGQVDLQRLRSCVLPPLDIKELSIPHHLAVANTLAHIGKLTTLHLTADGHPEGVVDQARLEWWSKAIGRGTPQELARLGICVFELAEQGAADQPPRQLRQAVYRLPIPRFPMADMPKH